MIYFTDIDKKDYDLETFLQAINDKNSYNG